MIRLIVCEEHPIVCSGLQVCIADNPKIRIVGEVRSGSDLLEYLRRCPCELVLLGVETEGPSGIDLIRRVKAVRRELPILVLTRHNDWQMAMRILRAGASGYITKRCDLDTLLQAIIKVAKNGRYISPHIAEEIAFHNLSPTQELHDTLSPRESTVLRLLVAGNRVTKIAQQMSVSTKTVSTHKTRLMEKLAISSTADLVRYAMEHDLNR